MSLGFSKISSVTSKCHQLGCFYAYNYISVLGASMDLILLTSLQTHA